MSKVRKRGYECAVRCCSTRNDGRTSFFRFHKDLGRQVLAQNHKLIRFFIDCFVRCQEWLHLCSRGELQDRDTEYLYNSSRVCAKHFERSMFLNDLHNRLQPHAKPVLYVVNILNETVVVPQINQYESHNDNLTKNFATYHSTPANINVFTTDAPVRPVPVFSDSTNTTLQSGDFKLSSHSKLSGNIEPMLCRHSTNASQSHVATQTPQALSSSSPRKRKLRLQINRQKQRIHQLMRPKEEFRNVISLDDFKELCKQLCQKRWCHSSKHRPTYISINQMADATLMNSKTLLCRCILRVQRLTSCYIRHLLCHV